MACQAIGGLACQAKLGEEPVTVELLGFSSGV